MYESPISIFIDTVSTEIAKEADKVIAKELYKVIPTVDEKELIRALSYDRNQYEKGYRDGYDDGKRDARCPHYNCDRHYCELICQQIITEIEEENEWQS